MYMSGRDSQCLQPSLLRLLKDPPSLADSSVPVLRRDSFFARSLATNKLCIYIYIYVHIHLSLYIYIYIYCTSM